MISQRWRLASIFLTVANLLAFATAQSSCINNGNYTSFSTYKANMDTLLSSLPTKVDINGFYNASGGQSPDIVYAAVLCRGDVQPEECSSCIQNATAELVKSCPNYKQAAHWNELCMLRYSDVSMFRMVKTFPAWYRWGLQNASSPVQYMADVRMLLDNLRGQAANGGSLRKVAAGNSSSANFQMIFSLVQCTPDLSPENCSTCLIGAAADIPEYCNIAIRCRVLWPSCNLRYHQLPFYNETRLRELQELATLPPQLSPPPPQPQQPVAPPGPPQLPPPPPPPVAVAGLPQQPAPPGKKDDNTRTVIIASVSAGVGLTVVVLAIILLKKRAKKKPITQELETARDINVDESLHLQYEFSEIQAATNNFSIDRKLGQGGFGVIYKGTLPDGQDIAVKRLSLDSKQGDMEFRNEVLLVAKLQHKNLVRLLGFSIEGKERLLVYEFVKNRSLDKFIFDPIKQNDLDWESRSRIIWGISKGLVYLHEESRLKIIHRDLKASNILLDGDMNPKIADFGMARLFNMDETQANTKKIVGTYGYMSPEYAMHGQFSAKSDVFSFGVLILEIVSGVQNRSYKNGENIEDLLSMVWKHWGQGTAEDIIDPALRVAGSNTLRGILRCIHIGLLCVQDNPSDRPAMGSVVLMLSSSIISLPAPFEPTYTTTQVYNSRIPNFRGYGSKEFDSSGSSAFRRSSTQSVESLKTDMSMTGFRPR